MRSVRAAVLPLCLAAVPAAPCRLPAQSTTLVVGVADAVTGSPLAHAQVRLPSLGRLGRADWLGEVRLAGVPRGRYTVEVRAMGYAASDITLDATGDSVGAVFMLQRAATALDTVKVLGERVSFALPVFREQFENRRKMAIGRFLVDSQLQRMGTRDLSVALYTALPGLRLAPGEAGSLLTLVPTGVDVDPKTHFTRGCRLLVYLDGAMYSDSSALNQLLPKDLAGVEYYDIEEAPPQYRQSGPLEPGGRIGPRPCKVLLLWSKY